MALPSNRLSLRRPILVGGFATLIALAVLVGSNILFTRYYLLATDVDGMQGVPYTFWVLVVLLDVGLVGIMAILVTFIVSNARQILRIRRQDSFVDGVTHELKSPLASLRLALDTLDRRNLSDADRDRFLGVMRRDVDRLQLFIEHILEAGRLQNNERPVELEDTDLIALVDRCVGQIAERHRVPVDTFAVDTDGLGAHPVLETDGLAVEIALLNLLDNAVKYADGEPRVELVAGREPSGRVRIAVRDHGVGLERAELTRIFNRFYRVAVTGRIRGTGLGLFVSRGLVRTLGGDLVADSDGPGHGSTFTLTLPATPPTK